MKFDWSNYLALAEAYLNEVNTVLSQENSSSCPTNNLLFNEAKLRCAISRAYYSAFCLARNYLLDVKEDVELKKWKEYDLQVHTYVAEKFRESKDKQYKEIGVILERIRKIRNKADYQDIINFNILLAEAKNSVKSAKHVIQLLETLKNNN